MTSFIRYELHWRADRANNWQAHSDLIGPEDVVVEEFRKRRWQICKAYVKKFGKACNHQFRVVMASCVVMDVL